MELDVDGKERDRAIHYLRENREITDVVVTGREEIHRSVHPLRELLRRLDGLPHITAVRLRSLGFNYEPHRYTHALVDQLGTMNRLSVANPRRLEIETQFLHSSEILRVHREIAGNLAKRGITVYNSTPLLPGLNDMEDETLKIAYGCRWCGIEFHHLVFAGHPLQRSWNEEHPANVSSLVDIATRIRRYESGRGIPRYIIRTGLGEVDFGLSSEVVGAGEDGTVSIRIFPYHLAYFRRMDPEYDWPEGITTDPEGHPIVSVPGIRKTPEFLVE
jgi:L-lysine 2,3-aminomutase